MRLSEKTIELNLCAQIRAAVGRELFWFGLTQKQEARAGFDACTRLSGKLLLLQFKASDWSLKGGKRRFLCDHDQLVALSARVRAIQRSVFYVFPLVGTTQDLCKVGGNLLSSTWLLDVACLPMVPAPTTRAGGLRKSRQHYVDVTPGKAVIHSDSIEVKLVNAKTFVGEGISGSDGLEHMKADDLLQLCGLFQRPATGLWVMPQGRG
ncbi:MAG: hypothetical protein NTY77_05265 [Elusimicrobia bacterium]|nr:hypothetical protein [Elusimicrobiota bacterium]